MAKSGRTVRLTPALDIFIFVFVSRWSEAMRSPPLPITLPVVVPGRRNLM